MNSLGDAGRSRSWGVGNAPDPSLEHPVKNTVTRSELIRSAVAFMIRYNMPATRESVYRALGTDYLPAECERAGYGDGGDHSIRAEKLLITAILKKLCYWQDAQAMADKFTGRYSPSETTTLMESR